MVSRKEITDQLKKIGFKHNGWGKGEVAELERIILPGEEIYECVNGMYEGGFALLLATDVRVLLVDKKPLNYLTVEDMRFDMISEMDYSHRLLGAEISISAGEKNLRFRSYNQHRLRKLIGHVQHCMAEVKKKMSSSQEGQILHLERINQQLQTYLMAQQQYQTQMQQVQIARQAGASESEAPLPEPPKPSYQLSDYLYAKSLLDQYPELKAEATSPSAAPLEESQTVATSDLVSNGYAQLDEVYAAGIKEIFGKASPSSNDKPKSTHHIPTDINPLLVAYSKLPMALRNRKLGRPSLQTRLSTIVQPKIKPEIS